MGINPIQKDIGCPAVCRGLTIWVKILLIGFLAISLSCSAPLETRDDVPSGGLRLNSLRVPPDAVAVMVAVVPLTAEQQADVDRLWPEWDAQAIGLVQRRVWDTNGMRIAVAPRQLPGRLLQILDQPIAENQVPAVTPEMLGPTGHPSAWRVTLRSGKPKLVGLTPIFPQASWKIAGGEALRAGQGEHVTGFLKLTAFPQSDGTVQFVLRPLLRHGDWQTKVGVLENALAFETAQQQVDLNELRVDVRLHPGQTIVATCTAEPAELGALLFSEPGIEPTAQPRLLLIRLVQSQASEGSPISPHRN